MSRTQSTSSSRVLYRRLCGVAAVFAVLISTLNAEVVPLTSSNVDSILAQNEVIFVNFYADWCRFSQNLKPIYEKASERFKTNPPGQVVWASVDCDREPAIAQKYHVSKYPTLKIFRNGEMLKKEYRGQRSEDALAEFITKQLASTVHHFVSQQDLEQHMEKSKRNVVAYYPHPVGPEYDNLMKVASVLREDCVFWLGSGDWVSTVGKGRNTISFRAPDATEDFAFTGDLTNYDYLKTWLTDKCVPIVREITFENAEELTEEGLPFLILFRMEGDKLSEQRFIDAVTAELADQKTAINTLLADGKKFAHPLHHLGKTEKDLPLIAIDSFRHMYLFPDFNQLNEKGRLRQFVMDLHSGKLHREFHHGPDPTQ
ncbi:Thioredoxin family protein, partial [Aphelenchoides avenae]